jgi:hypothetical protein
MVKKKFIQRRCVHKVPRSSLARPSRAVAMTAPSSEGSLSSASSSPALSALGARDAPAVEDAPLARTSKPVLSLREEDPADAPMVNLVSVPPADANLMGVNLIALSSGSEDEVNWEVLIVEDEVDWEVLTVEDDDVESVGSWSPLRI